MIAMDDGYRCSLHYVRDEPNHGVKHLTRYHVSSGQAVGCVISLGSSGDPALAKRIPKGQSEKKFGSSSISKMPTLE